MNDVTIPAAELINMTTAEVYARLGVPVPDFTRFEPDVIETAATLDNATRCMRAPTRDPVR